MMVLCFSLLSLFLSNLPNSPLSNLTGFTHCTLSHANRLSIFHNLAVSTCIVLTVDRDTLLCMSTP